MKIKIKAGSKLGGMLRIPSVCITKDTAKRAHPAEGVSQAPKMADLERTKGWQLFF